MKKINSLIHCTGAQRPLFKVACKVGPAPEKMFGPLLVLYTTAQALTPLSQGTCSRTRGSKSNWLRGQKKKTSSGSSWDKVGSPTQPHHSPLQPTTEFTLFNFVQRGADTPPLLSQNGLGLSIPDPNQDVSEPLSEPDPAQDRSVPLPPPHPGSTGYDHETTERSIITKWSIDGPLLTGISSQNTLVRVLFRN